MSKDGEQRGAYITLEVAAALIRVTPRRVQQLTAEGWIKKEGRGQYTIRGVIHGYLDFQDDQLKKLQRQSTENRVRDARAREIELRTAREENELVPFEEAKAIVQMYFGAMISLLNGLPAQITRDLDERRRIEAILDGNRAKLDEKLAELAVAYRDGPTDKSADHEDDAE